MLFNEALSWVVFPVLKIDKPNRPKVLQHIFGVLLLLFITAQVYSLIFGKFTTKNFTDPEAIGHYFLSGLWLYCLGLFITVWFVFYKVVPIILKGIDEIVFIIFRRAYRKRPKIKQDFVKDVLIKEDKNKKPEKRFFFDIIRFLSEELTKEMGAEFEKDLLYIGTLFIQIFLAYKIAIKGHYPLPNWTDNIISIVIIYFFLNHISTYVLAKAIKLKGNQLIRFFDKADLILERHGADGEMPFFTDRPILSIKQNRLAARMEYARMLRVALTKYKDKENFVVAITGEWGDGKTSTLNMALEELELHINSPVHVFRFNPWLFTHNKNLLASFFQEFKVFLARNLESGKNDNLLDLLSLYIRVIVRPIPGEKREKQPPAFNLEQVKDDLSRELRALDQKIIVVIDDIDRLAKGETAMVFGLIKSIADFPNTIYILAFDKDKVADRLSTEGGEDYLKKIVQLDLPLPPASNYEITNILSSYLREHLQVEKKKGWDEDRWRVLYEAGIKVYFLKNIRDIIRYMNALKFYVNLLPDGQNIIDFMCIIAIQTFDMNLYRMLRGSKKAIQEYHLNDKLSSVRIGTVWSEFSKYPQFREFTIELFPQLGVSQLPAEPPEEKTKAGWRRDGRICHEDEFDRFFFFPADPGQVIKAEMDEYIKAISENETASSSVVLHLIGSGKAKHFIESLRDYFEQMRSDSYERTILHSLTTGVEEIIKDQNIQSTIVAELYIETILNRFKIAIGLPFESGGVSFLFQKADWVWTQYRILSFFEKLMSESPEWATRKSLVNGVNDDRYKRWQREWISNVTTLLSDGRLLKHPRLAYVLLFWQKLESNSSSFQIALEKITASNEGLFQILVSGEKTVIKDQGKRGPIYHHEADCENILKLMPYEKLMLRLYEMRQNQDFENSLDYTDRYLLTRISADFQKWNKENN